MWAAFNHDGSKLVTVGMPARSPTIEVWDTAHPDRGRQTTSVDNIFQTWNKFPDAAVSSDGKRVAAYLPNMLVVGPAGVRQFEEQHYKRPNENGQGQVTAAAFFPDDSRLAVAFTNWTEVWTADGERVGGWLPVPGATVIVFGPDGRYVALANFAGVQLFDTTSGRPVGPARHRGATRVQFRPDGKQLLTASN